MLTIVVNITQDTIIDTRLKNVNSQFSILTANAGTALDSDDLTDSEFADIANGIVGLAVSRVQIIDRNFMIVADTYRINTGRICVSKDVNKCFNGENQAYTDEDNQCIVLVQAITSSETGEIEYVMFATSSISDIYSAFDTINLTIASILIILIIIIIFIALGASSFLVKPFRNINQVIEDIDNGHMEEDIELKGCSEVEDISDSFNLMLGKINQLEASRQEFVSNVSHELKTPLTSLKVLADSILASDDVPPEIYREFMENMSGEINRENEIITDLLTLVKLDRSDFELNIKTVNINDLLESVLRMIQPLADNKKIELILESYRPVTAEADGVKLSMAMSNLVENAVKYNNPEGWVHVSLNADQTYYYIKVQDNGFGIPKDSQEHIFERFYRVDKARDRAAGGTGLGLSITKSLVQAHNGEIKVYSEENKGTTFSIQIPLTYVKK